MKKTNETTDYHAILQTGRFYHVFNRTNNKELLFRDDRDRKVFLKRMAIYIFPYADIFSYCLMNNHFHILIRVKSVEVIRDLIQSIKSKGRTVVQKNFLKIELEEQSVEKILQGQFHRYFTAYSKYFNIRHNRLGALFSRRFKCIEVDNDAYLLHLVYYIHTNPVKEDYRTYPWSSYGTFLSDEPTSLAKAEVLEWFGSVDYFLDFHAQGAIIDDKFEKYIIE